MTYFLRTQFVFMMSVALGSLVLLGGISATIAVTSSTNYVIWADVISTGGSEQSTSANYGVQDTLGESIIGSATNTSALFGMKAGFRELYPDNYITLTLGTTTLDLGVISPTVTGSGSHTITVDMDVATGFSMTVTGATLTSGANTIDAIGPVAAASAVGTEQFGINLVDNATPNIGADPSGSNPIGSAIGAYGTANQFAFNSGDTIASSTTDINATLFTVSYIANVASGATVGDYTTTLTYAVAANL